MTLARFATGCIVAIVMTTLVACGEEEEPMDTVKAQPVCGLVDPALVAQVVGSGKVSTTGPGTVSRETRKTSPAHCSITAADASQPVVQIRIGEVVDSADHWRKELEKEAAAAGCEITYTDDPGYGYACDYTKGMYNPGSSVDVLRGDRIVRVTIYKWSGSTHAERVEIAEKMVADADANLTAYDKKQG